MSEERRINIRTLVIASIASAAAAIITSQFWVRGTPIAAALTPVIVAIVSEMLHRPTDKIVDRFTAETDALPEAAGAEPPPLSEELDPLPARDDSGMRVYRSERRGLPWGPILATAAAAFVIGAALITIPELVGGNSLAGGGRDTSLWGGGEKKSDDKAAPETETVTTPAETLPQDEPQQQQTETTPSTTPTTPQATEPQPKSTAPAPAPQVPAE